MTRRTAFLVSALPILAFLLESGTAQASSEDPMQDPVYQYAVANPLDLAGLDRISKIHTGTGISVALNGVEKPWSGTDAQRIMDQRMTRRMTAVTRDPADALTVGFVWVGTVARGFWDFRNSFVGGVRPVDMSSVQLVLGCTRIRQTITRTYDYTNEQTPNAAYLYHGGLGTNAPISAVKDSTSGHRMITDHGVTDVILTKPAGCGRHSHGGQYTYEHNQGQSGVSAEAGWGFLTLHYNGGGVHFQKGTDPKYKTF